MNGLYVDRTTVCATEPRNRVADIERAADMPAAGTDVRMRQLLMVAMSAPPHRVDGRSADHNVAGRDNATSYFGAPAAAPEDPSVPRPGARGRAFPCDCADPSTPDRSRTGVAADAAESPSGAAASASWASSSRSSSLSPAAAAAEVRATPPS